MSRFDVVRSNGGRPPQVVLEGDPRGLADDDDALFVALAAHSQRQMLEVDVSDVEAMRFGHAQAAGIHHLQQRAVAEFRWPCAFGRVDKRRDVVEREDVGQALRLLGAADERERVVTHLADEPQPAIERLHGADPPRHRALRHAGILHLGDIRPKARPDDAGQRDRVLIEPAEVVLQVGAVVPQREVGKIPPALEVGEIA